MVENALAGKNVDAITMLADSFRLHWKMAHLGKPYCVFIDGITSASIHLSIYPSTLCLWC